MTYTIKKYDKKMDWDSIKSLSITNYPWGSDYTPETKAWLYYIENEGFYLKMQCMEANPKATYTEANAPVYKDSCMEFFANFYPECEQSGYINFEMNSKGTILAQYGHPGERHFLVDLGFKVPTPQVRKTSEYWEVELFIPDTLIKEVYGQPSQITQLKGNFYKCGDETHTPHYGCWSPIEHPYPAFHLPHHFGHMIIA